MNKIYSSKSVEFVNLQSQVEKCYCNLHEILRRRFILGWVFFFSSNLELKTFFFSFRLFFLILHTKICNVRWSKFGRAVGLWEQWAGACFQIAETDSSVIQIALNLCLFLRIFDEQRLCLCFA